MLSAAFWFDLERLILEIEAQPTQFPMQQQQTPSFSPSKTARIVAADWSMVPANRDPVEAARIEPA